MTIKEIDHEISQTYKAIRLGDVSRKKGEELIDTLFMKKREAIALKAVPKPEKKTKYKK